MNQFFFFDYYTFFYNEYPEIKNILIYQSEGNVIECFDQHKSHLYINLFFWQVFEINWEIKEASKSKWVNSGIEPNQGGSRHKIADYLKYRHLLVKLKNNIRKHYISLYN